MNIKPGAGRNKLRSLPNATSGNVQVATEASYAAYKDGYDTGYDYGYEDGYMANLMNPTVPERRIGPPSGPGFNAGYRFGYEAGYQHGSSDDAEFEYTEPEKARIEGTVVGGGFGSVLGYGVALEQGMSYGFALLPAVVVAGAAGVLGGVIGYAMSGSRPRFPGT